MWCCLNLKQYEHYVKTFMSIHFPDKQTYIIDTLHSIPEDWESIPTP